MNKLILLKITIIILLLFFLGVALLFITRHSSENINSSDETRVTHLSTQTTSVRGTSVENYQKNNSGIFVPTSASDQSNTISAPTITNAIQITESLNSKSTQISNNPTEFSGQSNNEPSQTITPANHTDRNFSDEAGPFGKPGAEVINLQNQNSIDQLAQAGVGWIRYNSISWASIEPSEGKRDWEQISKIENSIKEAASDGINVILIIKNTPTWAQKYDGYYCGPIKRGKFDSFGRFMFDLVKKYSQPPFNVKYWELGNEPDVDHQLVTPDNIFGCWGDVNDFYYGGGYYSEMLKNVYPYIKQADPQSQVLIGGLLLDCDPSNPPEGRECNEGRFLEGILKNNGSAFFDIVSFHGYAYYDGSMQQIDNNKNWSKRGGVILGRADYLREVLDQYGLKKPLMDTESSFLCSEKSIGLCDPPSQNFYNFQAYYVPRLFIKNWATGIKATIWYEYEYPGWRFGSLQGQADNEKPAMLALRFMTSYLSSATSVRLLIKNDNVEGYEILKHDARVQFIWSVDENEYSFELPEGFRIAYDVFGNEVTSSGGKILVRYPIYIELNP